nr:unnamed protein product [Callosobruchus chinensis]
MNIFVR